MIVPYPTGLEPKNNRPYPDDSEMRGDPRVRAIRMAGFRILSDLIITILFLVLARQSGAWQLYQLSFFLLLLIAVDAIGALLIQRDRIQLGSILIIGGLLVLVPIAVALVSGLGLIIGLSCILVTVTSAYQSLPSNSARWISIAGILTGLTVIALDYIFPNTVRLPVPYAVRTLLPILAGGLVLVYAILIAIQLPHYSTRAKLIVAFLLISLIPLGLLAYFNNRVNQAALTESANQALFASASKTAQALDSFISTNLSKIDLEANIPILLDYLQLDPDERATSPLESQVSDLLAVFRKKDPLNSARLLSYSLLDKDRQIVADSEGMSPGTIPHYLAADRALLDSYLIVLLTGLPSVSPVKFDPDNNEANLYFMARISDSEGNPSGGLIAKYSATVLQDIVTANNNLAGPDSFGVLFDEYQTHLAHGTAPDTLWKTVAPLEPDVLSKLQTSNRLPVLPSESLTTNLPVLAENLRAAKKSPFFSAADVATGDRLNQVAVADLDTTNWQVAFFQPRDIFLQPISRQNRITLLLTIISVVLIALAAIPASQLISKPISRLTGTVLRIIGGDLKARAQVESSDEIGILAGAFNQMADQLNMTLSNLESQVRNRTADLSRRAIQLQTASLIARESASIRDIESLFDQTARLVSEQFGFYHCGLFLVDETGEFAVLQAASSDGGRLMLEKGHKLRVGQKGIVGFVASTGQARIALDVGEDAVYFDNPDLPLTRSEMALPLKAQNKTVGVLDVQSTEPSAFTEGDAEVLQIVADQIALALDNARLLDSYREAIEEMEGLYRQQTYQTWQDHLRDKVRAFRYDRVRVSPIEAGNGDLRYSNSFKLTAENDRTAVARLKIRGQDLGQLVLKRDPELPPWSQEERELILMIASQMSLALENIRLQEETRIRADREHMIGQVSARIRRSLDFETVLKTSVQEMQAALKLNQVELTLTDPSGLAQSEESPK